MVVNMPDNFLEWVAWLGIVLPLFALAFSAYHYLDELKWKRKNEEYRRLFELMDHLGRQEGSIASKMAAAYELRNFQDYQDVIVRLCEKVEVVGPSTDMLKEELELTKKHFTKK